MDEDDVLDEAAVEVVAEQRPRRRRVGSPCPKCGSADIRRSNYESFWVTINGMMGRWPFRCRNCRNLFFLPVAPPPES